MLPSTPSIFAQILDLAEENNYQGLSTLKNLCLGGETWRLTPKLNEWSNSKFYNCNLYNFYGTSESSDLSTAYSVKKEEMNRLDNLPIGKPIDNLFVYILDKNNQLQPIGLVGELCVSGEIIARGYLNRSELTGEKFVSNPWRREERMYKTGDLARWLPDGNLEYLRRIDRQIKLRGIRIEIGEIEAVLRQHPLVQEAVVIIREDVFDDRCLVAYLVTNQQIDIAISELRDFLNKKIPVYMIPSIFLVLEKLPLNPNGKVDHLRLPAPKRIREESYVAPRTAIEKVISVVWEEVLGLDRVGIHDNFFLLGGNSLLVIQSISRLRTALQVDLPLHYIFDSPTVSALAEAILQDPDKKLKAEKTAQILLSIAQLSEDEVEKILDTH